MWENFWLQRKSGMFSIALGKKMSLKCGVNSSNRDLGNIYQEVMVETLGTEILLRIPCRKMRRSKTNKRKIYTMSEKHYAFNKVLLLSFCFVLFYLKCKAQEMKSEIKKKKESKCK